MQHNIHYSPEALRDLDKIWGYIAVDLANPSAAANIVNGIMDVVDHVKEFSAAGSPLYVDNGLRTNYRFVMFENYIAFYRINQNEMYIDRILYGQRDYMKIILQNIQKASV